MSGTGGIPDLDRVMAGLRAQLERSARFEETIDLAASLRTSLRLVQLLQPRLGELRRAAGLPEAPPPFASWRARRSARAAAAQPVPSDRVFTFWNRPIAEAPPLVRACVAQLQRTYPHARVLDGAAARELVEIPERVATVLEAARPAHFSDYVRTRVLAEHGGIWVDATAWVDRPLDAELHRLLRAGVVFPRWAKRQIANWFIAGQPRDVVLVLQRLALDAWWESTDDLPDYFLYHRIFEVVQALVPEARGQWDAVPPLSATSAHLLQLEMMQPWRRATVRRILDAAPLQKLSYKYDAVPAGSVLERLLAGEGLGG
ncbi:capsular polysaccharide synthesis protein [Agromyces mediolanus]|uniref:capsular polysaccharide synthesis protein n=1 Tax=Agromyces mediolanus TaxID=41986 RepID=UPI00203F7C19|nr:capsular polysaccharide synthesis protein [Agromyces mediolanus]MCM3657669.1 capsular polysaccharide synthesis protein [Agromyces mediolanus]